MRTKPPGWRTKKPAARRQPRDCDEVRADPRARPEHAKREADSYRDELAQIRVGREVPAQRPYIHCTAPHPLTQR